jgi:uncharacterized protein YprB with RNaseH-like and TPR domain
LKKFIRNYRLDSISNPYYTMYYDGLTSCVFDIETTGLGGRNTPRVILTAMLIPTEDGIEVTQFLAESPYEEDQVLRETMNFLEEHAIDFLITYNGASFDIPFMNRRLEALHFPHTIHMHNLDLYSWLKRSSLLPSKLSSLSQKSVEKFLQIGNDRMDIISGKESVKLYYEYVTSHNAMLEKIILTHNREDVVQLYRILRRLFSNEFEAMLRTENIHEAQAAYSFPLLGSASLDIRPRISKKKLLISGKQHYTVQESRSWEQQREDSDNNLDRRVFYDEWVPPFPMNASIFPDRNTPYEATFQAVTSDYRISLPLQLYGNSLYVDLTELPFKPSDIEKETWTDSKAYVNDYLILVEDGKNNYLALNSFSSFLTKNILKGIREF